MNTTSVTRLLMIMSIVVGTTMKANAEMISGVSLGAQNIVNTFNNKNGQQGYFFTSSAPDPWGEVKLSYWGGEFVDYSAYSTPYTITTFCVQPNVGVAAASNYSGTLSYLMGKTYTHAFPPDVAHYLSVGGALLYQQYITADLGSMFSDVQVGNAIRYLMGYTTGIGSLGSVGWNDSVLQYLLGIEDDQNYWTSNYNPNAFYTEIGNYSVFVMNNLGHDPNCGYTQDYLYIAKASNPYDYIPPEKPPVDPPAAVTPEPATMLMFGMGLTVLPFARRLRKK